ncbi:nuclear pore complex protein NUP205-like, partial [Phalaenopsis equestris]|uniref:nuclear pore complex protein NUP205-like n=1 Tax=Phalaenopsis equestris TaxID=78828 RepID=UPI0009E65E3F
ALKLSDDLNLNEIECVQLLVTTNKEWILFGREPLEIYRLAAGLWYMERRSVITSLHALLRAVVLDNGLEADTLADIQKYLEELFDSGLRQRLIALIKELNREEPAGFGGPNSERYIIDFKGAVVERKAVVAQERVLLSHCLVLSVLVWRMSKLIYLFYFLFLI